MKMKDTRFKIIFEGAGAGKRAHHRCTEDRRYHVYFSQPGANAGKGGTWLVHVRDQQTKRYEEDYAPWRQHMETAERLLDQLIARDGGA
jgi:hypothetical protein